MVLKITYIRECVRVLQSLVDFSILFYPIKKVLFLLGWETRLSKLRVDSELWVVGMSAWLKFVNHSHAADTTNVKLQWLNSWKSRFDHGNCISMNINYVFITNGHVLTNEQHLWELWGGFIQLRRRRSSKSIRDSNVFYLGKRNFVLTDWEQVLTDLRGVPRNLN